MDSTKYMVILKGEISTDKIRSCFYNQTTQKYDVTFNNGKTYSYAIGNVIVLNNPTTLNPQEYAITTSDGKHLYDVMGIYQFANNHDKYWHIVFTRSSQSYKYSDLQVQKNCLVGHKEENTFKYLTEISGLSKLPETGERILQGYYQKVLFISSSTALSKYLDTSKKREKYNVDHLIFPFGCNQSQYAAVKNALENQLSVIEGPPGTGKTQTILNIIANLLIKDKSVMVVSNNNSATLNVYEKLAKEKYGMSFMVAPLGSADNKQAFVNAQTGHYPNLDGWMTSGAQRPSLVDINALAEKLQELYKVREQVARLKEKHYEIEAESKHFFEYATETIEGKESIKTLGKLSPDKIMTLVQELQDMLDRSKQMSLFFKLKSAFTYKIIDKDYYNQEVSKTIPVLQAMFYRQSLNEIETEIADKEKWLSQNSGDFDKQLEEKSLSYLKDHIARKYKWKQERSLFTEEDLYKNSKTVLNEYPIILSTTFSSRFSLNPNEVEYDYVIMDEASQVDIATGSLALSCAKNAVIVGDRKQLPNVLQPQEKAEAEHIRTKYNLNEAYNFARKSFLQSVLDAIPDVPVTLLREHYRCHPRIISFCNQKFYNNELVIMTEDDNLGKALMAYKTVPGNHARGNYNQRQIDIIRNEILPSLGVSTDEIGIIAPYVDQVKEIQKQIPGIETSTVHKFQGREKDVIILSTVDDYVKTFSDDPFLLNVAVSRAKKQLIVVVSGNEQLKNGNVPDLISYIQYNNMEVIDSKIYSVFDYLYAQYRDKRWEFLKNHKRISEYDSENLTYAMLTEILAEHAEYGVSCFVPLSMVIRDMSQLNEEEIRYALHPSTHLDFLIYNKVSKLPVAAVETDGYTYHKEGTTQHMRDLKKNHILEVCGLPLIRLGTNGSQEKEKVLQAIM